MAGETNGAGNGAGYVTKGVFDGFAREMRDYVAKTTQERKAAIDAASRTPAGGGKPGGVIASMNDANQSWHQKWRSAEWPVEQLKALGDAYGSPVAHELFCQKKNGRFRLSGIGPALVKLAAMSGHEEAKSYARTQGMPESYDAETFEKEYGFTTVVKAASHGVSGEKWGLGPDQVRKVALAEGSGTTGGYIIPPQFMNELLTIAAEDGFIEQRAKVIPMNSRTAQWPMLDITTAQAAGTSPYFGGILAQWQPEAASINETEPAFKQTEWVAWDLVLYTVSSNQLLADNGIGLDALLTQLFGQAITWYKEFAYLQGKGAGSTMPLGVLNAPATIVQSRVLASHFTMADAASMLSHLQIRSWDDACWIFHQSVIPDLIQMQDFQSAAIPPTVAAGHLAWLPPMGQDGKGPLAIKLPNAFLNGLPVFFTEKLPSLGTQGCVVLADWSRYVIGMRLDMQIDVSPHFLFRNNQLAWRVVCRVDGKPWLNSAITDQTGFKISPFITLTQ